jgi:hypothetical protein
LNATDVHEVLGRLGDALIIDGENLLWRGPRGMLTAGEREGLAKTKPVIMAALRGEALPQNAASALPELIQAGPYAGFLASPPYRAPDLSRASLCLLEALAYRLDGWQRDQVLREAHAGRTVRR